MPFSVDSFRELFGYGSRMLGAGLLDTIYNNSYGIVVGIIFSPTALGTLRAICCDPNNPKMGGGGTTTSYSQFCADVVSNTCY